jgi:phosphoribosylamine--glycine ligase
VVAAENPGWPPRVQLTPASGVAGVVALARQCAVDLVVVGPEAPLAAGLADALTQEGIACFGPTRAAAELETSKAFAKEVMRAAGVPTATALVVSRSDAASLDAARARCAQGDVVVKVDGLAAGKGVFVCSTAAEAHSALEAAWSFGAAADRVVLEDRLIGPEVSLFALCDGERAVALPAAQDHKRLLDGDQGPNTGGMGAYAPCGLVAPDAADRLLDAIHRPVLREMAARGKPFRGLLYAGLMMTPDGPRALEFNARFGDPETQPLMCLWEDDILPWLYGAAVGQLPLGKPRFSGDAACCVVLAAEGYPSAPAQGAQIPEPGPMDGVVVFHSGTSRRNDGTLEAIGGRVLGITGTGATLKEARQRAYAGVEQWTFPGAHFRRDIALRGLEAH